MLNAFFLHEWKYELQVEESVLVKRRELSVDSQTLIIIIFWVLSSLQRIR